MATDFRDSKPIAFMHREGPLKPDLVLVLCYLAITAIGLLRKLDRADLVDALARRFDERV